MSPKRLRQQNKTVTIYNSKNINGNGKKEKGKACVYEQNRNSLENWEFHFKENEIDEIKALVKIKDLNGVPLLIGATVLNQREIFENLLKHGYDINEADKNNLTPLAWAVKLKHLEMINTLIVKKADPSIKPHNGDDIIFLALCSNLWDEKSFVLFWNYLKNVEEINVNATNKNGLSMLHLAVRRDWNMVVDILTTNDVNINATNANGVTPLMLASYRNDYNIVTRLLGKGANVKRRNSDGFTALCYAFSSAILKNLSAPYLIIDKLQSEMAKNKVYLSDYLKERLKIIIQPVKKSSNDQPTAEQMLQHIVKFVMCNLDGGFNILWKELGIAHFINNALEKYLYEKDHVKLPLIMLNTIVKTLPFCNNLFSDLESIIDEFVDSGCFTMCFKTLSEYYNDDTITFLSFTPIVFPNIFTEKFMKWFENYQDDFFKYIERSLDIINNIDMSHTDFQIVKHFI